MRLGFSCPMCNGTDYVDVDEKRGIQLNEYLVSGVGKVLIQDALPDFTAVEREMIKTGYCRSCQKMLFGEVA